MRSGHYFIIMPTIHGADQPINDREPDDVWLP
jgi:hypothetical protein